MGQGLRLGLGVKYFAGLQAEGKSEKDNYCQISNPLQGVSGYCFLWHQVWFSALLLL